MADTLNNVLLPKNVWVDLYAASGIVVGTRIIVENLGATPVKLTTKATEPTDADGFQYAQQRSQKVNDTGDSGAWAISVGIDGLVNVKEVATA